LMKDMEHYIEPVKDQFSGYPTIFKEATYIVLGIPYDGTSTYRLGSRLGPKAIREASLNIETYSPRTGLYIEDLKICDLGDIKPADSLDHITNIVSNVLHTDKTPVTLGGEHTLTYYVAKALPKDTAFISFDAHYDLRSEYGGKQMSHAAVMRRIVEDRGPECVFFVGARAACKEESNFVERNKIHHISARQTLGGWQKAAESIRAYLKQFSHYYITVDMDVLDPAQAPGVGNPEPEGIGVTLLLDTLQGVCDERLLGFDLVEVAPNLDQGVTAVQAAKIIFEVLCFIESRKLHGKS